MREDLKALCLASRLFHKHVVPCLYERIDVCICDSEDTNRFMRSVAAGADNTFGHTRNLVIEDVTLPLEFHLKKQGTVLGEHATDWCIPNACAQGERDHHLATMVNMFPRHRLRRFRYVRQETFIRTLIVVQLPR